MQNFASSCHRPVGALGQLPRFEKAVAACPVKDDVVEQINAENHPRSLQLRGDIDVARRWFESAAGMIM